MRKSQHKTSKDYCNWKNGLEPRINRCKKQEVVHTWQTGFFIRELIQNSWSSPIPKHEPSGRQKGCLYPAYNITVGEDTEAEKAEQSPSCSLAYPQGEEKPIPRFKILPYPHLASKPTPSITSFDKQNNIHKKVFECKNEQLNKLQLWITKIFQESQWYEKPKQQTSNKSI